MATDPTDPTNQSGPNFDASTASTDDNTRAQRENKQANKENNDQIKTLEQSLLDCGLAVGKFTTNLAKIAASPFESFKVINDSIKMGDQLSKGFAQSLLSIQEFGKQRDVFIGLEKGGANAFGNLSGNIQALGEDYKTFIDKLPAGIRKVADNMLSNAEAGQKMEASFLNMIADSGKLNDIFDKNGKIIGGLTGQTAQYTSNISDVALASGLTTNETLKLAESFGKLSGFTTGNITVGKEQGEVLGNLTATIRTMIGAQISSADAYKLMKEGADNLSQAQKDGIDAATAGNILIADMSELQQTLGIRSDQAQSILEHMADTFKEVGDNTDAATKVIGGFTQALRDTGLTSQQSLNVIQGMIDGISKMTTGTKAFLSLRSGGAGGLQGAAQIDQLLRQGRLDQVVQMAQRSFMQQAGGRIYTQAEAAQSPEAASQFYRQRALLQSGAFGNLAKDDATATRLLEAFKSGNTTQAMSAIKTGQDALKEVSDRGNEIQKETNTILHQLENYSSRTAVATSLMASADVYKNFGIGSPEAISSLGLQMEEMRKSAAGQTAIEQNRNIGTAAPITEEQFSNKLDDQFVKSFQGKVDSVNAFKDNFSNVENNYQNKISNLSNTADEFAKRLGLNKENENIRKATPNVANPRDRATHPTTSATAQTSDNLHNSKMRDFFNTQKQQATILPKINLPEQPRNRENNQQSVQPQAQSVKVEIIAKPEVMRLFDIKQVNPIVEHNRAGHVSSPK